MELRNMHQTTFFGENIYKTTKIFLFVATISKKIKDKKFFLEWVFIELF
jgi:hypothetical protein